MAEKANVLERYSRPVNEPTYSTIEHVARICSPQNWKGVHFVMLTAGFDVSVQQPEKRFLVMAGFVSSAETWREFDRAWRKRLADDELTYFHMWSFAHSKNQFKGWDKQEGRRQKLLAALLDIIAEHAYHKFGCVVQSEALASLREVQKKIGNTMIAVAGYVTVGAVSRWRDMNRFSNSPEYVFEDGDEDKGTLMKVIKKETGSAPIFRLKKDNPAKGIMAFTPLQASDMLAFEIKKIADDEGRVLPENFHFRFPYERLRKIPGEPKALNRKGAEIARKYLAIDQYFDDHPLGAGVQ